MLRFARIQIPDRLEISEQRRDGRAQLVADVAHELGASPFEVSEIGCVIHEHDEAGDIVPGSIGHDGSDGGGEFPFALGRGERRSEDATLHAPRGPREFDQIVEFRLPDDLREGGRWRRRLVDVEETACGPVHGVDGLVFAEDDDPRGHRLHDQSLSVLPVLKRGDPRRQLLQQFVDVVRDLLEPGVVGKRNPKPRGKIRIVA